MPHVNKKTLAKRKIFSSYKKLVLDRTMNGLGKPFRKKMRSKKLKKKDENQTGIAACEQKITSEKVNFRFLSLF